MTDRYQDIDEALQRRDVPLGLLQAWMRSADPVEQGAAFEVLTSGDMRSRMEGFIPSVEHPRFCLRYLIARVLSRQEEMDDRLLTTWEALWELRLPMDSYWDEAGAGLTAREYWRAVADMCRAFGPEYNDRIVTHFLEACAGMPAFRETMRAWRKDALLARYVRETEAILGPI